MALRVNILRFLDVTVMEMDGRLSLGESAQIFRDAVRRAVWDGHTKVALDYSNVTYQDSSGLGDLIAVFTELANSGGQMVLFNLRDNAKALLRVTKLISIFEVFESREAVLAHFASKRSPQFQIANRRFDSLSVLVLAGSLSQENGASKLASATASALELGAETIVFLFRQVLDIDPFGVDTLLASCQAVRGRGGNVVLAGVEDRLEPAIAPAARTAAIPVHDTLDGALKALGLTVTHNYRRTEVSRA